MSCAFWPQVPYAASLTGLARPSDVCAEYAQVVNKGEAMHSNQWDGQPYEMQMGFVIPIQYMLNVTRLRDAHPVLTVAQYLRLHDLPSELESSDGSWLRDAYHTRAPALAVGSDVARPPALFVVENQWYVKWDEEKVRVDRFPEDMKQRGGWVPDGWNASTGERGRWANGSMSVVGNYLLDHAPKKPTMLEWEQAVELLREQGLESWDLESDEGITQVLQDNGWEVLYTFKSMSVVLPCAWTSLADASTD
jgi:hypothetical protein